MRFTVYRLLPFPLRYLWLINSCDPPVLVVTGVNVWILAVSCLLFCIVDLIKNVFIFLLILFVVTVKFDFLYLNSTTICIKSSLDFYFLIFVKYWCISRQIKMLRYLCFTIETKLRLFL